MEAPRYEGTEGSAEQCEERGGRLQRWRELGAGPEVGNSVYPAEDTAGAKARGGRGPGKTGWWLCVTRHQALLGRDLRQLMHLDVSHGQQGAAEGP